MADIKLVRPSAGQTVVVPSVPDARMVLDFSADQVSIDRPQGSDSLFFHFDDGSAIELQNFYTQYNKDDIPSFEVDGQLIAGADFFSAFGPDLAPAAGPTASPTRSGRYSDFANSGLEDGVNHLDGLDYRLAFNGNAEPDFNPYASPFIANVAPALSTGSAPITMSLTESGWDGKSAGATPVVSQSGLFSVADPDGDSLTTTVSMGGKVVAVSTTGPTTIESNYGTFVVTPKGSGSNITFEYTYTLKQDPYSPADSLAEGEKQVDNIVFSINDGKGHTVTQPINVVITGSNDAPDITGVGAALTLKEDGVYANQPVGDTLHADELNAVPGVQATLSGTITAHDPDHGAQLYFGLKDTHGNLLDMTSVDAAGMLKGSFVIGSVNNPDHTTSDVLVTGITEQGGQIVISTNYGDLVLEKTSDTTAMYTFTLKNTTGEGATNKLAEGQQVSLQFEPYVRDEYGAEDGDSSTLRDGTVAGNAIVINIQGTNDAPTITQNAWNGQSGATALTAVLTEASDSTTNSEVAGTIIGHDVDNGDSLHYGLVQTGSDTMHSKVYVVLGSDGHTLTTTTDAATAGTAKNYVGEFNLTESADPTKGASYTFTLYNDSPAVQGMQDGDSRDVSIGLVARDSFGAYVQESVSVTVKGANDTPVITTAPALAALAVVEAGVKDVGGDPNAAFAGTPTDANVGHSFTVTDVDNNDTQTVSIAVKDGSGAVVSLPVTDNGNGTYTVSTPEGTFTLKAGAAVANDSGSGITYTYSYAIDNAAANSLSEGESRNYIFTVTITDSQNASVSQTIGLTVTGTNDLPVLSITPADSGHLTEDATTRTSTGAWAVADPDHDGNSQTISVSGMGKDASGVMDTNAHTGDPVAVTTDFGTLTLKADGTYTYVLDNSKPAVQALGASQSHTETFTVTTTDAHGAHDTQTITVVIHGSNDNPVIGSSSTTSVSVEEAGVQGSHNSALPNAAYAGTPSATGLIVATDVDDDDKGALKFSVANGQGTYGTLTIDETTGQYTYILDNTKADSLNEGQEVTETFTVTVNDAHGGSASQEITVNITGANDKPTLSLSAPSASTLREDSGAYTSTGAFTVVDHDVDGAFKGSTDGAANQTYSIAPGSGTTGTAVVSTTGVVTYTTDYGSLTVNPDGTYAYTLNNASNKVQNLGATETHVETFNVTVTDLHGSYDTQTVSFTIHGSNDQATIDQTSGALTVKEKGVTSGAGTTIPGYANQTENGTPSATGSFTVKDMDTHDTLTATLTSNSTTITTPVMSGAGTWIVNDAYGTLTITGVRSVSPTDGSESITYTYTYAINQSKANALAEGENKTLDYHISVTDGTGTPVVHDISITVQGTNDAPTVTAETLTLKDDGAKDGGNAVMAATAAMEGHLTGTDADHDAKLTYGLIATTTGADAYKHLGTETGKGDLSAGAISGTLAPNGGSSQSISATFVVTNEGETYPGTGGGTATVVEVYAVGHSGEAGYHYGTLYLNESTGKYTFTLDTNSAAVNSLGSGDKLTLNFQAVAVDTHNASSTAVNVPIVIYGTNDKPVLTLDSHDLSVTDQTNVTASSLVGNAHVVDPDAGDTKTFGIMSNAVTDAAVATPAMSTSVAGNYGTFSIDPTTGQYTYTIAKNNADVIALGKGEGLTETFTVAVVDKYGAYSTQTVTVTVNGHDDPTYINASMLTPNGAVTDPGTRSTTLVDAQHYRDNEPGRTTVSGKIGASDADNTDAAALKDVSSTTLQYVIVVNGVEYNLNVLMLEAKSEGKDSFSIAMPHGTLVVSLNASMAADGALFKYDYNVNTADAVVNALTSKESLTDTFTVNVVHSGESTPESSAVVAITIHGVNDRPTIAVHPAEDSSHNIITYTEDSLAASGKIVAADPDSDHGGSFAYSLVTAKNAVDMAALNTAIAKDNPAEASLDTYFNLGSSDMVVKGQYGYLVIDQNGNYEYHRYAVGSSDYKNLNGLNAGDSVTDTFYVRVRDAQGAYSQIKPIEITLEGTNDKGALVGNHQDVTEQGVVQGSDFHSNELHFTSGGFLGANDSNSADVKATYSEKITVSDVDNKGYDTFIYETTLTITDGAGKTVATFDGMHVGDNTLAGYGVLTLSANGNYSFTPDQTALNHLNTNDTLTLKLGVDSTSTSTANGNTDAAAQETVHGDLSITLHGTNDAPVVSGLPTTVVGEVVTDADVTAWQAKLATATDSWYPQNYKEFFASSESDDLKSMLATEATRLLGILGPVQTHEGEQLWASIVANNESWLLKLCYTYTWSELNAFADGSFVTKYIDLFIAGGSIRTFLLSSDGAGSVKDYLSSHTSGTTIEAVSGSVSGTGIETHGALAGYVSDVDSDKKDLRFFAVKDETVTQAVEGKYGTLIIQPDGTYSYVLNRADADYLNLAKGASGTESFTVYVRDEHYAVAEKAIPIIITVTKAEDGSGSGGSSYMTITDANNANDAVIEDVDTTATGSIKSGSSTVSNDSGLFLTGKYTEKAEGDASATDHSVAKNSVICTDYGTLVLMPDGSYTYTLNNDNPKVQGLAQGEKLVQTFNVVNGHGDESTITITISGTNDNPYVLSDVKAGDLHQAEGGIWDANSVSGSFTIKDIDHGDAATLNIGGATDNGNGTFTVNGKYGSYVITPGDIDVTSGTRTFTYEYTPNSGVNYVGNASDEVKITIADGHGGTTDYTLSVKLSAENDAPTLSAENLTATEDGTAAIIGTAHSTDTDTGFLNTGNTLTYAAEHNGAQDADGTALGTVASSGLPGIVQGQYGTLLLNTATGTYEYRVNNDSIKVQQLGENEEAHDTFTITVTDAGGKMASQVIDVTIQGTNDVPSLSLHTYDDLSSASGTGASLYLTADMDNVAGTAQGIDVDVKDTLTYSIVAKDAGWADKTGFVLDQGQLRVAEAAETPRDLTVLDVFVVKGADGKWSLWDGSSTDKAIVHLGTFSIVKDSNGQADYFFTSDKDGVAHLGQGETFTINATVSVSDGHGGNSDMPLQVNVLGSNDAPVVHGFTGDTTLTDNGTASQAISGAVNASDVDGDTLTYYIKSGNAYVTELHDGHGTLKLVGNSYTYELDADYAKSLEALGKDATTPGGSFTVVAVDKYGAEAHQTLDITLKGVNNDPTFTAPSLSIVEGASPLTGNLGAADVDTNDAGLLTYSLAYGSGSATASATENAVIAGHYGQLSMDASGNYSYTLTSHELGQGAQATDTFTVTVSDGHGGTASHDVVVNITGTNDAPVAHLDATAQILSATDVDQGDHLTFSVNGDMLDATPLSVTEVNGAFGTLTFTADATHTDMFSYGNYELDSSYDSISKLAALHDAGSDLKDTFTYTVSDGHTANGQTSGSFSVDIDADNWDGHGGHLLFGAAGNANDMLTGTDHNDILYGGGGDDKLYGGDGDDILYGGTGHNELHGGDGDDTLHAGNEGDHLYGDAGNDHLYGGAGSDFLDGGLGHNELYGGAGNDLLVFHPGDVIDGGEGLDFLLTSNPNDDLQSILGQTSNVEVAIKGGTGNADAPLSLTSLTELLKQGITVTDNSDGSTTMTLNKDWSDNHDGTYTNSAQNLTLSTAGSLASEAHDDATEAAKFILTNSHT